ncbi:hypothetical protein D3C81_1750040 [compost metagenome]
MDSGQWRGMRFCRRSGAYGNPVVLNKRAAAAWNQQAASLGSEILRPGRARGKQTSPGRGGIYPPGTRTQSKIQNGCAVLLWTAQPFLFDSCFSNMDMSSTVGLYRC